MTISFFPSRANMIKEVDRLIAAGSLDVLTSLCNCCLFRVFEPDQECRSCKVHVGIRRLVRDSEACAAEEGGLLRAC
jgi:hypothetical protein